MMPNKINLPIRLMSQFTCFKHKCISRSLHLNHTKLVSPAVAYPRISKEKWFKVSPEGHEIWDQLDDCSKSIILAPPDLLLSSHVMMMLMGSPRITTCQF